MPSRFRMIRIPFWITTTVLLTRLVMETAGISGFSLLNILYLIPVFGVYLSIACLRQDMGFGRFISTFLLYAITTRLVVVILSVVAQVAGLESSYFFYRNIFFLILPQLLLWPIASYIIGTILWPIVALIIRGSQISYRGFVFNTIVMLFIIFGGIPYGISMLYTSGLNRRSFENTPSDHGVTYENVTLTTADDLSLQGWYLPHSDGLGTVIFCHGLFQQRSEMLEQAIFMHEQGYRCLLFDFRHHGVSDGDYTTFGYYERQDVEAALRYVMEEKNEEGPVILWGISMGAANSLLTAAEQPDVDAIIAESSFFAVRETLRQDLTRMFRLPIIPFAPLIEMITEFRLDMRIDDLHVGNAVARINDRPILLVGGTEDQRMPIRNNERLLEAIPSDMKDHLVIEGAGHADAWEMATDEYKAKVTTFLDQYLWDSRKNEGGGMK